MFNPEKVERITEIVPHDYTEGDDPGYHFKDLVLASDYSQLLVLYRFTRLALELACEEEDNPLARAEEYLRSAMKRRHLLNVGPASVGSSEAEIAAFFEKYGTPNAL